MRENNVKQNTLVMVIFVTFFAIFLLRNDISEISNNSFSQFTPKKITSFELAMSVIANNEEVTVETYLPANSELQSILHEQIQSADLNYNEITNDSGRSVVWRGVTSGAELNYKADIHLSEKKYNISPDLKIERAPQPIFAEYLSATKYIQVNHPEIEKLWQSIKPKRSDLALPVLKTIFEYTSDKLSTVPFKGTTDALTALRLGEASCNGKSRLFVALARLNGIPARLIGGVILTPERKKTSHQWVEVYLQGHWIPFGPTNNHFAELPDNYLVLYYGDQVLFTRTADIQFNYSFKSSHRLVADSLYSAILTANSNGEDSPRNEERSSSQSGFNINVADLLFKTGMNEKTASLFLLFPLCTLVIGILRNIVGIKTFGVFLPMLIAAACTYTGLWQGITAFIIILGLSFTVHYALAPLRLLKISRLATIITVNTLVFVLVLMLFKDVNKLEFGMLSLFPVVIISFVAERIHRLSEDSNWQQLLLIAAGTLLSIVLTYALLKSFLLISIFSFYPEVFLLVIAGQIYVGRWAGIRVSELFRFHRLLSTKDSTVLGINSRNLNFVDILNDRENLILAADKIRAKQVLAEHHVAVPETLASFSSLSDLVRLEQLLEQRQNFALKPNMGSQGNGILIIKEKVDDIFYSASGKPYSREAIREQCVAIINGQFSQGGDTDLAYFEPLLIQHHQMAKMSPFGLSDIRIIVIKSRPVSAMLRIPTRQSDGKANLHQGAVGVAVNIVRGDTFHATQQGNLVEKHPDTQCNLIGIQIPFWKQILEMSIRASEAIPLGYLGVDICIDETQGPLVLEVNGRPGIEIQNVQDRGLYFEFSRGLS